MDNKEVIFGPQIRLINVNYHDLAYPQKFTRISYFNHSSIEYRIKTAPKFFQHFRTPNTHNLGHALYDRILLPHLSKYTSKSRGIGVKQRIGIGLFISCMATAAAAMVERTRRTRAIEEGLLESPKAQVNMTAMWLIPQHCLTGLAEAFNLNGQIELYYSQFPNSMGSIAAALFSLDLAIGNLVGSLVVTIVDVASKRGGKESWVSSNLNKGHYDYYYWILTILCAANFFYYIVCSRAYKCCENDKIWDENTEEEVNTGAILYKEAALLICQNLKTPLLYTYLPNESYTC